MTYHLKCMSCKHEFKEDDYYNECPKCGGVIEAIVDNVSNAKVDNSYDTILKYHQFLPVYDPASIAQYETTKKSPLIDAGNIAKKYGFKKILLKDETVHATGTMKDREGLLTVNRLLINNIKGLVIGSSGNAGIALAWFVSKVKGPKLYLYLPENSRARMAKAIDDFTDKDIVKVVYINGSTDEAEDAGKIFAKENGIPYGTGFNNYSRREGVKTLALEYIFENKIRADWYSQGVAGALAVYAFYKAHKEVGIDCPKLACIQPSVCTPLVDAFKDNANELLDKYVPEQQVNHPAAPVLKSRKPYTVYPIMKSMIEEVGGAAESVTPEEIVEALHDFYLEKHFVDKYHNSGRRVGIEASTALAGIIKLRKADIVKSNETVLVNVSGAAKPTDIPEDWWDTKLVR